MSTSVICIPVNVNMFDVNCYLGWCSKTNHAFLIDPGCFQEQESLKIINEIKNRNLILKFIINTHGHVDHICANRFFKKQTEALIAIHTLDKEFLTCAQKNGSSFFGMEVTSPAADIIIKQDSIINIGDECLKVIHTPGHTQGSVCLYWEKENILFSGDTLFAQGIGRTDLPGGSLDDEIFSIKNKLWCLKSDTQVFPGHGAHTSIAIEKASNPFLL